LLLQLLLLLLLLQLLLLQLPLPGFSSLSGKGTLFRASGLCTSRLRAALLHSRSAPILRHKGILIPNSCHHIPACRNITTAEFQP
jgi:hypothetical protein